MPLNDLVHL